MQTRREITKKFAREYAKASRAEKGKILTNLTASTGWTRDHARRAIRAANARVGAARDQQRRPKPRKYSYDALVVLQEVWRLAGQPSGKYLAAVMDDTLDRLLRHHELVKVADRVTAEVIDEVRAMSAATIDRYLQAHKAAAYPAAGLSGTRPSQILRASISTRTPMDDPITTPGFLELDTVAHCGHSLKGDFLWTLSATDPYTGWTMLRTVKNKAFLHIHHGLNWLYDTSPIPIAGIDCDNGSEFLNWSVVAWCDAHHITMTRGRPYHSNDNAHIEQRNGDWVRKHAFRYRYETDTELALLNDLWAAVMLRKNFLLPCVKAIGWTTTNSGRKKRVYDKPRTPYQRLIDTGALDQPTAERLAALHADLNPASLTRKINTLQNKLIDIAATRTIAGRPWPHPDKSSEASAHPIRTS